MLPRLLLTPLPRTLEPPARDLLRGLRRAMSGPKRLFEPVGALLPSSLRDYVDDLATRLDERRVAGRRPAARHPAGRRTGAATPALAAALRAATPSLFMASGDAALDFAVLSYYGLSEVLRRLGRADLMVSETVAGYAFQVAAAQRPCDAGACEQAAAVALGLLQHHVIGRAPGTGIGLDAQDIEDSRVAIFVVVLWLLLERAELCSDGRRRGDEMELLDLCFDVAAVERGSIVALGADRVRLAALLRTLSRLI